MIALQGIRKTYGKTVAVESVTFTAADGVVTGLLGPNGAGKTTALRVLGGIVRPDSGTAHVDSHDVQRDPRKARALLGMLPESVGLYDHLTVREHLVYAGALHGLHGPDLMARAKALLQQLGLDSLTERRAGQLSLGQRRRVALARTLVHDPPNVVLDEPTNGLDVLSAREVRREIRRLAERGCAVVLSSHVMPEVASVCDRIVILSKGTVVSEGTPADILALASAPTLEEAFVQLIGTDEGLN